VLATVPFQAAEGARDLTLQLAEGRERPGGARPGPTSSSSATSHAAADQASGRPPRLVATLVGADAIAADDRASVVQLSGQLRVGVVADPAHSKPPTGGPPPIEQAFAALRLGIQVQPLAAVPEHAGELEPLAVLVVDDVPGFTPEARRRLAEWVEQGGVLLLALGPRAAAAPLGAGFGPMLPAIVRWHSWSVAAATTADHQAGVPPAPGAGSRAAGGSGAREPARPDRPVAGIDVGSDDLFGPTAEGLAQLHPFGRAWLDLPVSHGLRLRARWADGQPFLVEHRAGRGVTFACTLPLSSDWSDFALRPAFLLLLQHLVDTARTLGGVARSPVGTSWALSGFESVKVQRWPRAGAGVPEELDPQGEGAERRFTPELLGLYELVLDSSPTYRVAAVQESEIVVRPRGLGSEANAPGLGTTTTSVDISRHVALALLVLLLAELLLRVLSQRTARR
jgi:hypothetical protein